MENPLYNGLIFIFFSLGLNAYVVLEFYLLYCFDFQITKFFVLVPDFDLFVHGIVQNPLNAT